MHFHPAYFLPELVESDPLRTQAATRTAIVEDKRKRWQTEQGCPHPRRRILIGRSGRALSALLVDMDAS